MTSSSSGTRSWWHDDCGWSLLCHSAAERRWGPAQLMMMMMTAQHASKPAQHALKPVRHSLARPRQTCAPPRAKSEAARSKTALDRNAAGVSASAAAAASVSASVSEALLCQQDNDDNDDFDNPTVVGMYCKTAYLNLLAYVSASPCNTPTSVPGRLAVVGFGWFLLITISSYTANLASILVAQQKATNQIWCIQDAIAQKQSICLHPVIAPEIKTAYPIQLYWFKM